MNFTLTKGGNLYFFWSQNILHTQLHIFNGTWLQHLYIRLTYMM